MSNESNNSSFRVPGLAETLIKSLYVAKDEIIKQGQASIDVFVQRLSPVLDSYVIKEEASGEISLVSGEVYVCLDDNNFECHIEVELYFKNKEAKWVKKSIKTDSVPLEWTLLSVEQERLKQVKKIKYSYEHP